MKKYLSILSLSIIAVAVSAVGVVHASPLPATPALFETSLAAPVGVADTSLTLVQNSLLGGNSISGFTCFTVDSNNPNVEYICGNVSGTNVTGLSRGISPLDGTTTLPTIAYSHRRGADVKITDFPSITILQRIFSGFDSIANPFSYSSSVATSTLASNRNYVPSVGLLQDTAFNSAGVINATIAARGVVQIATPTQVASSTTIGSSGATLVIPSSVSSSTSNLIANVIPVTNSLGKIADGFISTSTLGSSFGNATTSTSTTFTSTTTPGTWTKPQGAKMIQVILIGAGAGGQSGQGQGGSTAGGVPGYSGGYTNAFIPASLLPATVSVSVGGGGNGGSNTGGGGAPVNGVTGGNTLFGTLLSATGGSDTAAGTGTTNGVMAGTGGSSNNSGITAGNNSALNTFLTGGIVGISTIPGGNGLSATSTWPIPGGGGGGGFGNSTAPTSGGNGGLYGGGGGGGGGRSSGNDAGNGGKGADGIADVITYF